MEKRLYLSKEGKLISPQKKRKMRSVWFWIGMQTIVAVFCFALIDIFQFRFRGIWPFQWTAIVAIWYWQMRSAGFCGFNIVLHADLLRKWNIIRIDAARCFGVVYKKVAREDGALLVSILPFRASRHKWINILKFFGIKLLVRIRIIK